MPRSHQQDNHIVDEHGVVLAACTREDAKRLQGLRLVRAHRSVLRCWLALVDASLIREQLAHKPSITAEDSRTVVRIGRHLWQHHMRRCAAYNREAYAAA